MRSKGGNLGFLRAQIREARTPLGVRQYCACFWKTSLKSFYEKCKGAREKIIMLLIAATGWDQLLVQGLTDRLNFVDTSKAAVAAKK